MGAVLNPTSLEQSAKDIAEIVAPILGPPLSEISYGQVLIDIVRIGTRYEVRLPRELVLVAQQLLYFARYAQLLGPRSVERRVGIELVTSSYSSWSLYTYKYKYITYHLYSTYSFT